MPRLATACLMLPTLRSKANSGSCTPITTRPSLLYLSAHAFTYGSVRRQLMHEYVQISSSTTLPRRPWALSGGELSHCTAPDNGGMSPSTGKFRVGAAIAVRIRDAVGA